MRERDMWRRRHTDDMAPPAWTADDSGPRVLIEHPDPDVRYVLGRQLSERGYSVRGCGGPSADGGCPILAEQPCPAVDGAEFVVNGLLGDSRGRLIARRIRRSHPDKRIVVEATDWMAAQVDTTPDSDTATRRVYPLRTDAVCALIADADPVTS
jgi:hypothetical protein